MGDDKELFERAMETLGVKDGARNARRPRKPAPPGVAVTEDLDFDAIMQSARGPATEMKAARNKGEAPASEAPAVTRPTPAAAPRARYAATPEESREFLAAMQAIGTEETKARHEQPSPRRTAAPADDLGRRLKRGEVEADAVLDLHGRSRREAERRLAEFLAEALRERWEIVSIVVGRGVHSDGGEPVLRPYVERWLREDHRDEVLELHPAPPYLGGSGAWIVALRSR